MPRCFLFVPFICFVVFSFVSNTQAQFCPKCGLTTLQRAYVNVTADGRTVYKFSKRELSNRGKVVTSHSLFFLHLFLLCARLLWHIFFHYSCQEICLIILFALKGPAQLANHPTFINVFFLAKKQKSWTNLKLGIFQFWKKKRKTVEFFLKVVGKKSLFFFSLIFHQKLVLFKFSKTLKTKMFF